MKFPIVLLLISLNLMAMTEVSQNKTTEKKEVLTDKALKVIGESEEDCDDKAKKPIEIKPESIRLNAGDAGCTIE